MTTPLVRPVLTQLQAAVQHLSRFSASDAASQTLFATLERALRRLLEFNGEAIRFSLSGPFLLYNGEPLSHESLEFGDLGRQVASRGVESISIEPSVTTFEVIVLTQFLAGVSAEPPAAGGGVHINDEVPASAPIAPPGKLRAGYQEAVETLRAAVLAARTGEPVPMEQVTEVVNRLLTASSGRPLATALLATMRSSAEYFYHHSVNTTLLAIEMGRAAGMRVADLRVLGIGALLHDLGKGLVVPEAIEDPGRLGAEQWRQMQKYPSRSALAILEAGVPGTEVAAVMAYEHNVRHDLSGYPQLPEGSVQHPAAALLSVVDVYDAVTSRRPYRRAETNGNALGILLDGAGTQFSPSMVRLFVERFGTIPPGSCFRLADGRVLVAVGASDEEEAGVRGLLVEDGDGEVLAEPEIVAVPFEEVAGELSVIETKVRPAAYLDLLEETERGTAG